MVFGHLGDGNLHVIAGVGKGDAHTRHEVEEIVYGPLQQSGDRSRPSTASAWRSATYLPLSRSEAEIAAMRAIKNALDPRGILNPGKVIEVAAVERDV